MPGHRGGHKVVWGERNSFRLLLFGGECPCWGGRSEKEILPKTTRGHRQSNACGASLPRARSNSTEKLNKKDRNRVGWGGHVITIRSQELVTIIMGIIGGSIFTREGGTRASKKSVLFVREGAH